jgi:CHASE2 domain-containing sensor protein
VVRRFLVFAIDIMWKIIVYILNGIWRLIPSSIKLFLKKYFGGVVDTIFLGPLKKVASVVGELSQQVRRPFFRNLLIGLMVMSALMLLRDGHLFVVDAEEAGIDWMMQLLKGHVPSGENKNIPGFVFLDIDNDSRENAWKNQKFITPRNRLRNLIRNAVNANAKLVVVDVNTSLKTPLDEQALPNDYDEKCQSLKLHPEDCELYKYLRDDYPKKCQNDKLSCSPIIFSYPLSESRERDYFLKEVVNKNKPYAEWATVEFPLSEDHVNRHWYSWRFACEDGQYIAIPSVQLLVATLIQEGTPLKASEVLKRTLPTSKECSNTEQEQVRYKDLTLQKRIIYSMPWITKNDQEFLKDQDGLPKYQLSDEKGGNVLRVISAKHFAEEIPGDSQYLSNRIVVIGGSWNYGSYSDIHLTPLGKIPGGLVLINAIHSRLLYSNLDSFSTEIEWMIMVGFVFIITVFFTVFSSHEGMVFSGLAVVLVIVPSVMLFFKAGVWLSFVIPSLTVYYTHIMIDIVKPHHACSETKG